MPPHIKILLICIHILARQSVKKGHTVSEIYAPKQKVLFYLSKKMLGICKVDRKMENCFYEESQLSLVVLQWRNTGQSNRMLAVLQRLDGARNPAMCTSLCLKAILSAFWGVTGFHDRSRNIAGFRGVGGFSPDEWSSDETLAPYEIDDFRLLRSCQFQCGVHLFCTAK